MAEQNILIWLPSPMGDAIMATPTLRALRRHFDKDRIFLYGSSVLHDLLFPTDLCDIWIQQPPGFFRSVSTLKAAGLSVCILLKNSFSAALAAWLAGIPRRIGYARDGRSRMLTDRIAPLKEADGRFTPTPAIDYYLRIAQTLGADTADRTMELTVINPDTDYLKKRLPAAFQIFGPLVIMVPGGAFGPSKCWSSERFAQTADALFETYHATVVISIAPNSQEKQIAADIQRLAKHPLINLGDTPLDLETLKALFARADLVVTNDTGPRHIAIALKRKVITLFGPNNPQWTQTGYPDEIQVIGTGPCVPCDKPVCRQNRHYCMESITVEQVLAAARKILSETAA